MFLVYERKDLFSNSSPPVLLPRSVISLTSCVEKLECDLFVYAVISLLCFFLFAVNSLPHPVSLFWLRGAVMECLAVTEQLLARDCSFLPIPGGLLFMFISSVASHGADLSHSPFLPWSSSTVAH